MRNEHIIEMLESRPFSEMSEDERARLRAHAAVCAECGPAFEAAEVSSLLLKASAAEAFEPSPFFQTRVMAAWRERQAQGEQASLWRLWKTAGALVSSMAATVAMLAVLTFTAPTQTAPVAQSYSSDFEALSAEEVIMEEDNASAEQMNYDQVLITLYGAEEDK
jgi:hypothetical protein